ncbi:MAG TPA: COR domain-containing protein, partial [Nitrosomonas nitrosa]|nr:COR domain-containing protein [Nitrosomonas nitrosa]
TQISDLSPLSGLQSLQELYCSWTQISDLSPLSGLQSLQELNCSHCSLKNLSKELLYKATLTGLVLHKTKIPGIPSEILSLSEHYCCLQSLRSHFIDLKQGAVELDDIKLMVLGNGQIGKTQICRQLRKEKYDDQITSTHGILVSSASFPLPEHDKTVQLNIWDFGGQDIYHSTHALFMRTRAIFMLVWIKSTNSAGEHVCNGMAFRDEPLGYWLQYIKYLSDANNPVLIVQTQCDNPEDEARYLLNVNNDMLESFRFCKPLLHYSSLKNRGREALEAALRDAWYWLRERQGASLIGVGRYRVKRKLEELRAADAAVTPEKRQHRTISQEYFRQLCVEGNGTISSLEHLLDYLHNTGTVFYRKGLFDDHIILDQSWALDAIYTVFHREKCFKHLRLLRGRFTRALLNDLVWNGYSKDEQLLFLSMMQSCGICFIHQKGDKTADIEDEYIAPDLLPDKEEINIELEEKWDSQLTPEVAEFEYELHHPGLLRSFVSQIGSEAGVNALYWKNGVCFYEETTRSRALIEQESHAEWQGKIRIQTQQGQASTLLARLRKLLTDEHERWDIRSDSQPNHAPPHRFESEAFNKESPDQQQLEFAQESKPKPEYFVSYAWKDASPEGKDREKIVDKLCDTAEKDHDITIIRDKDNISLGESITKFMKRMGRANRVFVVLSDKYLKSPYCMFELHEIWRNSLQEESEFLNRIRVYILPCANIDTALNRTRYAAFWKKEKEALKELIDENGFEILGENGFKQYSLMQDFTHHVGDILAIIVDKIQPRSFEELIQHGFNDAAK